MKKLVFSLGLVAATALFATTVPGCGNDDPPFEISDFSLEMAQTMCAWTYGDATLKQSACCDTAEQGERPGGGNYSSCVTALTNVYQDMLKNVDVRDWNGGAARSCVTKVAREAAKCDRNFELTASNMIRNDCNLVRATQRPGDTCQDGWNCTTGYCKNGICANPLAENSPCVAGDVCAGTAVCAVDTCKGLQPDGAACQQGTECFSGACGAGKCINSDTYTCDGK